MKAAILIMLILPFSFCSCKKDFLDAKPSTDIAVPNDLDVLAKILSGDFPNNYTNGLGSSSADEYYFQDLATWQTAPAVDRNCYIWAKDTYQGERSIYEWNYSYTAIFNTNVVLDEIEKIERTDDNRTQWNNLKGWALFIRAWAYHQLVSVFSSAYDKASSSQDLGLPLKLSPNVDEIKQRATLQETYDQIIEDAGNAVTLLQIAPQKSTPNVPSKSAAYALLAKVYLNMRNYDAAALYADSSLRLYSTLIDYNTISTSDPIPFAENNAENMFFAYSTPREAVSTQRTTVFIDSILYRSYSEDDLRKRIFFSINTGSGKPSIKRGYNPYVDLCYGGIATDEVYLIKAEALARKNAVTESMDLLNKLITKRWKAGTFSPYTASSKQEALEKILMERRKELVLRGVRWSDLKRLNKEGANITITRKINGQVYSLPPNSPLYVLPIPDDEIALSGIQQNPR